LLQVAGKLEAVGGRLSFVEHCFTRIVRRADASDAGGAQEVRSKKQISRFWLCSPACFLLACLPEC